MYSENIYSAMRSLYRLISLKKMNIEILIKTEKNILSERISKLKREEIDYIINNFKDFYKLQLVQDSDNELEKDVEEYIFNIN